MVDPDATRGPGLDYRGFLEFQYGLLGDDITGAATDRHRPLTVAQGLGGRQLVGPGSLLQSGRQALADG